MQSDEGRVHLNRYAQGIIVLGKEHGVGIVLESATCAANRDRGATIGALAETDLDMISAYTVAFLAEAIGISQAAKSFGVPVVVAFTVEIVGRVPTGALLEGAIKQADVETGSYASYFMSNCAHPNHFLNALIDGAWIERLRGIVANASKCSHAELGDAKVLDAGNPIELGEQLAQIRQRFPHINGLGSCCGTDMRYRQSIATNATRLTDFSYNAEIWSSLRP